MDVNYQLQRRQKRLITLRTRLEEGERRIFATVTPTYSAVDSDGVLHTVTNSLADAHVEMRYDGSGVRATALWMPDQVVDLAAGDVFKVGSASRPTTPDVAASASAASSGGSSA